MPMVRLSLGRACLGAALGLLLAGALRAEATLALANGLYLVFILLGDMLFPLTQLPDAAQVIAELIGVPTIVVSRWTFAKRSTSRSAPS